MGVVKSGESSNKLLNLADGCLEAADNLKLLLNSLDFLGKDLLLVLRDGNAHSFVVVIDGVKQTVNSFIRSLQEILSLLQIGISGITIEDLLHLLNLFLSGVKFIGNSLAVLSITNECTLGLVKKLESVLCLLFGIFPSILDTLDIGLKELGLVRVLQDDLTLGNEICDNVSLGVKLGQRLLLSLNQLIHILQTRGGDVPGGGQHDAVKELNMGLQLVTVGVALPVEVHHDSGLLDIGDQLLVLLDQGVEFAHFCVSLILGALGHQDFQNLLEPFPDLSPLQIFAQRVEGVSFSLELGGGVDLVSHNSGNRLLHILHPLGHLQMPHVVHLLDELVVLLPKSHFVLPLLAGLAVCV